MRSTKLVTISVLPELLHKIDEIAREESRTRSELWREVMRRYVADRELKLLPEYGEKQAKKSGLQREGGPRVSGRVSSRKIQWLK
jgi:CopG family transcriptional regulator/antitoxin EndoAI